MNRPLLRLLALATLWAASPSEAGPRYMIAYNNGGAFQAEVYSTTGFSRDTSFALAPSNGSGTLTGGAHAGPGYVSPFARVNCTWSGGFSGAFWGKTRATIQTDDFIISGPAGPPVPGTLRLRVRVRLEKSGGFSNNNGHSAAFHLNASTLYSGAMGTISYGNGSLSGTGPFAGVSSPNVDMIVSLSGNYPVNTPFTIQIYTEAIPNAYGNVFNSPGMVSADAGGALGRHSGLGVQLEAGGGPVMTLPPGYTLNSASWGVVNNTYPHLVAVEGAGPPRGAQLALRGPNPSSRETRLSLALPRDGDVRVTVYDVTGRARRTLLAGRQGAGDHALVWDGRDDAGEAAPAGLYFVHAEAEGARLTRAVVRMR